MKSTRLEMLDTEKIVTLKRNPQFLTPKQMESLKLSIKREGFVAPILVRPLPKNRFEVISGNHRFMAACELGLKQIPAVISNMSGNAAKRLAVNLNMIHGDQNVELLAPFLAEMPDSVLGQIHFEDDLLADLLAFDKELSERLDAMQVPDAMNNDSKTHKTKTCKCKVCGTVHIVKKV